MKYYSIYKQGKNENPKLGRIGQIIYSGINGCGMLTKRELNKKLEQLKSQNDGETYAVAEFGNIGTLAIVK